MPSSLSDQDTRPPNGILPFVQVRNLGHSGLKVSEIALGNWLTQGSTLSQSDTTAIVKHAYDLGIFFFDTADVYANGAAETALGEALKDGPRRQDLVIASKCYFPMTDAPNDRGLSRKHIFESVHASLKRLGTDYLDLLQCHRFDPETPVAETAAAYSDLIRQGKILYWGVSEWSGPQITEAAAIAKEIGGYAPISNQPRYSIFERYIEAEVIPASQAAGLGQVVFSPLAQGVLTGKYLPGQAPQPGTRGADADKGKWMGPFMTEERLAQVQELKKLAEGIGITVGQLALAWCLRQKNLSACIIGATSPQQLNENVGASGVSLSDDILQEIDRITLPQ